MVFESRGMIHALITPRKSMGIRSKRWRGIFGEIRRSSHGIWKKEADWGVKSKRFVQNCGRIAINKSDPVFVFQWRNVILERVLFSVKDIT